MIFVRTLHALWLLGGLALLLGAARERALAPEVPDFLLPREGAWHTGDFQPGRAYPTTSPGALPPGTRTIGSWVDSDAWRGSGATPWSQPKSSRLRVYVAGYPGHRACSLRAEFKNDAGNVSTLACKIADPHETWSPWDFRAPAGTTALRIVADDQASDAAGWIAFSEPMVRPSTLRASTYMAAQVVSTCALTLSLVWLPGLLWSVRARRRDQAVLRLLVTGPAAMVLLGGVIWVTPFRADHAAVLLVAATWLSLGIWLWLQRTRLQSCDPGLRRALSLSALVVVAVVAKASYSGGPDGELYSGSIYRTLAVGDRSDPRISFQVVQTVAHRLSPASAKAEQYFTPWTFFSRGPVAGLAAVPIVLATTGVPPTHNELLAWQPFDVTGYAAYRIVLIVLASSVIVALFAAIRAVAGQRWGWIAAGLLALCPFGMHEVMFTWPKLAATAYVLLSFLFVHHRRTFAGGVLLGFGFLFHPLAALWAPWLAAWAWVRARRRVAIIVPVACFGAGVALFVLPWLALGYMPAQLPGSGHAGHGSFFRYFVLAEYQPATWQSWWQTRWMNFSNTFIPFWLHAFNRTHPVLSATHFTSDAVVKFAFGWWNTLPLGLGLGLWALSCFAFLKGLRTHWRGIALFVIGPALLLTAYWGASSTGLMRECGHPLFVGVIGVTCVVASSQRTLARWLAHPIVPWLQLPETLLMLWLTTARNERPPGADFAELDPVFLGTNVLALIAAAAMLSRFRSSDS